jgi:hypothetical protein
MARRKIVMFVALAVIVIIASAFYVKVYLLRENSTPQINTPTNSGERRNFLGIIRNVRNLPGVGKGLPYTLDIDKVDWLYGEEAIRAVMQDFNCARDKVEDCAPSMNNNFYV